MPASQKITCPECAKIGRQCRDCKNARRRRAAAKRPKPAKLCARCGNLREPKTMKYCRTCAPIVYRDDRIRRDAERAQRRREKSGAESKPKAPKVSKPKTPKAPKAQAEPKPKKIKIDKNRKGGGVVIYNGEKASSGPKKAPRKFEPRPETQEERDAFINELERHCCGSRYWLRRRFWALQTVAFWVASDGREYQNCPGCGRVAA